MAIVTGASKGIGAGIALHLAAAGAKVAVNYASSKDGADKVVSDIAEQGGTAIAIGADVSNEADAARLISETLEAFGQIDIIVNNAAYFRFGPVEQTTLEGFRRHFETNVFGPIQVLVQALDHLGPGSSIINIGSAGVVNPINNAVLYGGSKAALEKITTFMAKELGPREIRVNMVRPGATDTEGNRLIGTFDDPEIMAALKEHTSLGRIGTPDDVAPAITFLASDDARWITGAVLDASGGFS